MISFLGYSITQANESHFAGIAKILNFYVEKNLTAELGFFGGDNSVYGYLEKLSNLPFIVVLQDGTPVGFGLLKHDCKAESFSHSAELSYFVMPEHTGKGVASAMIKILEERASVLGIWNIFVAISSNRLACIPFHQKMGYLECGRLPQVGYKNESYFDIIYYRKTLIGR